MSAIRNVLRAGFRCSSNVLHTASNHTTAASLISCQNRQFSSTSPKGAGATDKIYELRTYSVHPKDVKPFLDLTKEWIHLRTGHSKLVGYWTGELGGGINELVHIWEYDTLSQRAKVRANLAGDQEWLKNYLSNMMYFLQRQDNALLTAMPGCDVIYPKETGTYELQHLYTGKNPEDTAAVIKGLQRPGASLCGSWYNSLTPCFGWLLWFHKNIDNVPASVVDIPPETGLKVVQSRIISPVSWSPMP